MIIQQPSSTGNSKARTGGNRSRLRSPPSINSHLLRPERHDPPQRHRVTNNCNSNSRSSLGVSVFTAAEPTHRQQRRPQQRLPVATDLDCPSYLLQPPPPPSANNIFLAVQRQSVPQRVRPESDDNRKNRRTPVLSAAKARSQLLIGLPTPTPNVPLTPTTTAEHHHHNNNSVIIPVTRAANNNSGSVHVAPFHTHASTRNKDQPHPDHLPAIGDTNIDTDTTTTVVVSSPTRRTVAPLATERDMFRTSQPISRASKTKYDDARSSRSCDPSTTPVPQQQPLCFASTLPRRHRSRAKTTHRRQQRQQQPGIGSSSSSTKDNSDLVTNTITNNGEDCTSLEEEEEILLVHTDTGGGDSGVRGSAADGLLHAQVIVEPAVSSTRPESHLEPNKLATAPQRRSKNHNPGGGRCSAKNRMPSSPTRKQRRSLLLSLNPALNSIGGTGSGTSHEDTIVMVGTLVKPTALVAESTTTTAIV